LDITTKVYLKINLLPLLPTNEIFATCFYTLTKINLMLFPFLLLIVP